MLVLGASVGPTPARRVSWTPGAEGAPAECALRCEWVVVWPAAGAILIDCEEEFVREKCFACLVGLLGSPFCNAGEDEEVRRENSDLP